MNASSRNSGAARVLALTVAVLLLPIHALAQVVEPATATVTPVAPSTATSPAGTSEVFGSDTPAIAVGGTAGGLPLFQWGPLGLRPHATYRGTYRAGAPVGPGDRVDTGVHAFSPGLLVDVGDHWIADYTITWTRYTNRRLSSRPNHAATLTANYAFTDWSFSAGANYLSSHPTLLETSAQSHEIRYGGNAALQHRLTRKLSLDLAAADSYDKAERLAAVNGLPLTSTHEVSSQDGLSWFVTDRTVLSPSVRFGSATRGEGPRMTYVTPQVSVSWTPTDRISLGANIGEERRTVHDNGSPTLSSTISGASILYQAFAHTVLRAEVTRGVSSTYLANALARNRGWTVALDQQLFALATLTLSASDRRTSYLQTAGDLPTTRSDRSRRYQARLGVPFLQRGQIAVFYEHIRNKSDTSAFSFSSSEYGVEVGYRF